MKRFLFILMLMAQCYFINAQTDAPLLSSFHDIPDVIDGGACLFALSKEEFQNQNYILVNDMALYCCVNCNNKIQTLELVQYDEGTQCFYYQNSEIKLSIQIIQQEYQTKFVHAKIIVTNSEGTTIKNIVGKCDL